MHYTTCRCNQESVGFAVKDINRIYIQPAVPVGFSFFLEFGSFTVICRAAGLERGQP